MALPALFHTQQKLGAVQVSGDTESGRVQFRLFFPQGFNAHIASILVSGTFQSILGGQNWENDNALSLTQETKQEGDFWTLLLDHDLPKGFYEYKYRVTFDEGTTREAADPLARYSGQQNGHSGFVIGGSSNVVTPLPDRKPLRDLVVYELHAGDFTDEYRGTRAPFDAIRDKLDYLADLGITALLVMPWTAWKDKDYDWGYSPFQYFAVEYAYANDANHPEEKISWLKNLISACHAKGIHVILDGVFNHCDMSFPYKTLYLHDADCPYTAVPFGGTFPGLQDIDFNNACTQAFIRDVCLYWISEFGIDGIRFDNTVNYYVAGDPRGIPDLLQSIQDYLTTSGQSNFSMTLEHLQQDAASLVNSTAATSYWDNGLYGRCFSQLLSGTISPSYLAVLNNSQYAHWPDKVATLYLSNHDHSTVAWAAGYSDQDGAHWYRVQPHIIALLTAPGTPLIPSGQEFSEDYWVPENDAGTGRRVRPRPLHWKEVQDGYGGKLLPTYKQLLQIRAEHPALRSNNFYPPNWADWMTKLDGDGFGVDVARGVVVYHRWGPGTDGVTELFYIALNFSGEPQSVTLSFAENGTWSDLLNGGKQVVVTGFRLSLQLESYWGHVFFKRSGGVVVQGLKV